MVANSFLGYCTNSDLVGICINMMRISFLGYGIMRVQCTFRWMGGITGEQGGVIRSDLHEPVDVYAHWVDQCEELNQREREESSSKKRRLDEESVS